MTTPQPIHDDPWIAEAAQLLHQRAPTLRASDALDCAATMRQHWSELTPLKAVTCYLSPMLPGPGDISVAELL